MAPPLGELLSASEAEGVSRLPAKLPPTSLALGHLPQRGRRDLAPPLGELLSASEAEGVSFFRT